MRFSLLHVNNNFLLERIFNNTPNLRELIKTTLSVVIISATCKLHVYKVNMAILPSNIYTASYPRVFTEVSFKS